MSDRLAVSASLSVFMMSIYVLFGSHAARLPLGPVQITSPYTTAAPRLPDSLAQLSISSK